MDFSELQHSWQQQPTPAAAASTEPAAHLLADAERLHGLGRRRNRLSTVLIVLAVIVFTAEQLLREQPRTATQNVGLLLLDSTLLGFLGLMWWGTRLRQAARADLDSRTYLQATLRAFRFRRTTLLWLSLPYALGFGMGLALNSLPWGPDSAVKLALWLTVLLALALLGRQVGLRRYEQQFGDTERAVQQQLAQLQLQLG